MSPELARSKCSPDPRESSTATLVVAHPGHELRVHAWLARARPRVFVLTDGSGHGSRDRLDATARALERAGAPSGSIFGRFSDRDAYQLILDGDLETVKTIVLELADHLTATGSDVVASDAIEGFNPVHDLCFIIAESAVRLASRRLDRAIRHFDFPLESAPDARASRHNNRSIRFDLDEDAWQRKMDEARANEQLRFEVERALEIHGPNAFRVEFLREVVTREAVEELVDEPPFYETHGEKRVADGTYDRVLRFRQHFLPLAVAIRDWSKDS